MTTAMQRIEIETTRGFEDVAARHGLRGDLIDAILNPIRRGAIALLDMRTEFEILAPGDLPLAVPARRTGLMAAIGFAFMNRTRRAVSVILDPWTEFVILD